MQSPNERSLKMTIQELVDMLLWFPGEKRREKKVYFRTTDETSKTEAQIKSVRYYPEHKYIDIEVE